MRLLFISPNSRKQNSVDDLPLTTPPINLMYLAQSARSFSHKVMLLDAYVQNLDDKDIISAIRSFKPDMVFIPLYSSDLTYTYNLTRSIKEHNESISIVLGGHHPSLAPDAVMEEFTYVDYILRGEAEHSIVELISAIENSRSLKDVLGLSFRAKGKIMHNAPSLPIDPLDEIPIPSRDLVDIKLYRSMMSKRNPLDIIVTTRGCPAHCSFCSKVSPAFQGYRMRSAGNVLEELKLSLDAGAKSIEFYDELFTANRKRIAELMELMKKEKMDFEFRIRTRVDCVDRKLLENLSDMGCTTVSYGVESGNQDILDRNGKGTKIPAIEKAFSITHETGMNTLGFFLMGFKEDTPQTIRQTIDFAKRLNPKYATFDTIRPFPGTRFYNESREDGTLIGDWGVGKPMPWVKLPWTSSQEDLNRFVSQAYREYYYRPSFAIRFIQDSMRRGNWQQLAYTLRYSLKNIRDIDLS